MCVSVICYYIRQFSGDGVVGLRVDASSNLFMENLHNTRHLETTYYVTDVKQQTDFFWYRESGVRINIGLQNVNVVPLYEDVEHQADNSFVSGSPHSDDEKAWFDDITRRHCRCAPATADVYVFYVFLR